MEVEEGEGIDDGMEAEIGRGKGRVKMVSGVVNLQGGLGRQSGEGRGGERWLVDGWS